MLLLKSYRLPIYTRYYSACFVLVFCYRMLKAPLKHVTVQGTHKRMEYACTSIIEMLRQLNVNCSKSNLSCPPYIRLNLIP